MQHAWYSAKADRAGVGVHVYAREDGTEVLITAVHDTEDGGGSWDDTKYLGLVSHWVRSLKPSRHKDLSGSMTKF